MRAYFLINGIRTTPGDEKNWNGRGVTWIHNRFADLPYKAEKIEYECSALGRAFGQKDRAEKFYRTLSFYRGDTYRVAVTHSNGSDVAETMFRDYPDFQRLDEFHAVCGATQADCERSGISDLLRQNRIGTFYVYVAGKDLALRLASLRLARLLGYGTLGLHGPLNVKDDVKDRIKTIRVGWETYGHSTAWDDDHFEQTMREIVRP